MAGGRSCGQNRGPEPSAVGSLVHRDFPISRQSARLVELTSPASHGKATRELGWHPTPTEDFIQRAARTYVERSA